MDAPMPFCAECGDPRLLATGYSPHADGFTRWCIYGCGHVSTGDPEPFDDIVGAADDVTVTVRLPETSPTVSNQRSA